MASPISQAIKQICEEKNLSEEVVLQTIEAALAAAYRKDFGKKNQNVRVEFDPEMATSRVFDVKIVVSDEFAEEARKEEERLAALREAVERGEAPPESLTPPTEPRGETEGAETEVLKFNPKLHLSESEARLVKPDAQVDEELKIELEIPAAYGRMAAQTAKQVILQRLREAERSTLFDEFKSKEHSVIGGIVQRREGRVILVDLGRVTGVMPPEDAIPSERYMPGDRVKVYVSSVTLTPRGPEIRVSRTHPDMVRKLFELEIPEVASGVVLMKEIARDAGARSKVAVASTQENVDPVGSCIGQRGSRIQTIINELGGEKVDIITWDEDVARFIGNALSPAKVVRVEYDPGSKTARVLVAPDQLSLAIGRGGQNVRLAARLTDSVINITEEGATALAASSVEEALPEVAAPTSEEAAPAEASSDQV